MSPTLSTSKSDAGGDRTSSTEPHSGGSKVFSIPSPIKWLFDRVPVVVYPQNSLPQRAPKSSRIPSLYVFSSGKDAAAGRPSFNPSCLKWQVSKLDELSRAVGKTSPDHHRLS